MLIYVAITHHCQTPSLAESNWLRIAPVRYVTVRVAPCNHGPLFYCIVKRGNVPLSKDLLHAILQAASPCGRPDEFCVHLGSSGNDSQAPHQHLIVRVAPSSMTFRSVDPRLSKKRIFRVHCPKDVDRHT